MRSIHNFRANWINPEYGTWERLVAEGIEHVAAPLNILKDRSIEKARGVIVSEYLLQLCTDAAVCTIALVMNVFFRGDIARSRNEELEAKRSANMHMDTVLHADIAATKLADNYSALGEKFMRADGLDILDDPTPIDISYLASLMSGTPGSVDLVNDRPGSWYQIIQIYLPMIAFPRNHTKFRHKGSPPTISCPPKKR